MGLSLLNPIPNPMEEIGRLRTENSTLRQELREAQEEAAGCRREATQAIRGVQELRSILSPLYQGLQRVFGEIDAMGVSGEPHPATTVKNSGAWESWKQRMPGIPAQIIDLLMIHGELTSEQMRIHVGTKRKQSIYDATFKLNKAGLLNKNGDRFSLKEL
jgi:hypothetical protein